MTQRIDVAVIGAGPGGAMAAREAARQGASVLLIDKASFPRDKVCGCCLNASARATLHRVGLGELLQQQAATSLRWLALSARKRTVQLPLPPGSALSRYRFDMALIQAAVACGVTFRPRCRATLETVGTASECPILNLTHGPTTTRIQARAVVVADGLAGRLLHDIPTFRSTTSRTTRIGCGVIVDHPANVQPGHIHMHCGRHGYVGMVRLEDGRLNVAAALDPAHVRAIGGPGAAAASIVHNARGIDAHWLQSLHFRGTPGLTHHRRCIAAHRIFVLGDAAGYVEPFTGEGIAWALEAGADVADIALAACHHWSPALAHQWKQRHASLLRRRHRTCRLIAVLLRSPVAIHATVELLSRWPRIARPVISHVATPASGAPACP